jgi:hypothetical protein
MSCEPENEDRKKELYKILQQDIRSQIFYEWNINLWKKIMFA